MKKSTRATSKRKRAESQKREKEGLLFVLSGPSGSGKTTLAEKILAAPAFKNRMVKSVSFTTRPKRPGEVEGRDYFFITPRQFQGEQKAKRILEWTNYLGYYYGTPKGFVDRRLAQGKHLLMCLDIHGARRIKRLYPRNSVTIFIEPPSLETLRQRLLRRSDKTDRGEMRRRVRLAREELLVAHTYNYRLVNADLDKVVGRLKKIILSEIHFGLQKQEEEKKR